MAGELEFVSFLGRIVHVHLRGVLGVAPGFVLAGVEHASGEGALGVSKVSVYRDLAFPAYSYPAAVDAGATGTSMSLSGVSNMDGLPDLPSAVVYSEVHGNVLEGRR
jgi:hypothetical protein